jgi:sigma-B regulation protein RsbU (phosphoserine phosphatase)
MALAVVDDYPYESRQIELGAGDSVLIFSDGVTDAMDRNNRAFQQEGIVAAIGAPGLSPSEIGRRLMQAVERHAAGRSAHDDIALVCFGRCEPTQAPSEHPTPRK